MRALGVSVWFSKGCTKALIGSYCLEGLETNVSTTNLESGRSGHEGLVNKQRTRSEGRQGS